ncbi:MAG TPA: ThuA domain-containing protein [Bacteroidales bacterium]|nr:ThuA domain-containing protein [Bacteroidales bacterium]
MKKLNHIFPVIAGLLLLIGGCSENTAYKALIVTGQGKHNWQLSSENYKTILERTGLFSVKIKKSPAAGSDMGAFNPGFSGYNLVVVDFNGDDWSDRTRASFVEFVKGGGGAIITQAAGSAFPNWKEFTIMCGYTSDDKNNSKPYEFEVRTVSQENPVVAGLPARWIHASDILQSRLTGPSGNTEVLATAFSDTAVGGSGKAEPVLIAVKYGNGRIFHTTLGSASGEDAPAMKCSGFIATLQRGAEWAAAGKTTQDVPFDFPSASMAVTRTGFRVQTMEDDFAGLAGYRIDKSTKFFTDIQGRIRAAKGNSVELKKIETMMIGLLRDANASVDGKKLILRELSWMGSDNCVAAIKELTSNPDLKDDVAFALERLKAK